MPGSLSHITQSRPAFSPPNGRLRRAWLLVVAGLLVTAVASLSLRPVCRPDVAGADESGFGVRHEQRQRQWYHCEPWIRRALAD